MPPVSDASEMLFAGYATDRHSMTVESATIASPLTVGENDFPLSNVSMLEENSPQSMAVRTIQVVAGSGANFSTGAEGAAIMPGFSEGGVLLTIPEQSQAEAGDLSAILSQQHFSTTGLIEDNCGQIQQQSSYILESLPDTFMDADTGDDEEDKEDEGRQYPLMMAECKALVDVEFNQAQLHKVNVPTERITIDEFSRHEFNSVDKVRDFYTAVFEHCGHQSCPYYGRQSDTQDASCRGLFSPLQIRQHLSEYHGHKYGYKCKKCNTAYLSIEALDIHIQTEPGHINTNSKLTENLYVSRADYLILSGDMHESDLSADENDEESASSCAIVEPGAIVQKDENSMDVFDENASAEEDFQEENNARQSISSETFEHEVVLDEGAVFDTYELFEQHIINQKEMKKELMDCPFCESKAAGLIKLKEHLCGAEHKMFHPYKCGVCESKYMLPHALKKHVEKKHYVSSEDSNVEGVFVIAKLIIKKIQAESGETVAILG